MIAVDWSLTIGRSPDDVFRHVAAIERYPDWQRATGIRAVIVDGNAPVGLGSGFRMERLTQGQSGTLDGKVTVFEPGRRFAFRAHDSAGFDIEADTTLSAVGAGTRLDWHFTMTTPGALRFVGSMLSSGIRRAAEADLGELRRRLEQVA